MNDDDFKMLGEFCFMTDGQKDICDCRVAFATENQNHGLQIHFKTF